MQNIPLPLKYPKELDEGIWGGEAVLRGFHQKDKYTRRVVRYWSPVLMKEVLYSEILDKYMNMIVTRRTMDLVHEHYGFDHYLLAVMLSNCFVFHHDKTNAVGNENFLS